MQKLTTAFSVALAVLVCCGELLQAAPYSSTDVPSNPVYFKRFHRTRPSKRYADLDVFEVRELYYVRRATPKPKPPPLTNEEIDQLIRCDFDPTLPECKPTLTKTQTSSTSTSTSTTTTTTTTSTPQPTTTIPTTTEPPFEPFLPALPMEPEAVSQEVEATTVEAEAEVLVDDDDLSEDQQDRDDMEDEDGDDYIASDEVLGNGGSIGGNDVTLLNSNLDNSLNRLKH